MPLPLSPSSQRREALAVVPSSLLPFEVVVTLPNELREELATVLLLVTLEELRMKVSSLAEVPRSSASSSVMSREGGCDERRSRRF